VRRPTWVLAAVALLAAGAGCSGGPDPATQPLPWQQAAAHVGEWRTVVGPVVDAHYAEASKGRPTFLDIGKPYPQPGRLTVVIWGDSRERFPSPPEAMYVGRMVRVTGLIQTFKGDAEIVVASPASIEVEPRPRAPRGAAR
jgi:DNA/RNA endonuclease YhcR with UshA esterase domain